MLDDYLYPLATVGGLILAPDGEVLLVKSKKWIDCFTIPGGKIELGETREEAFIREVKEETSLKLFNIHYAFVQDSIFNPQFWKKRHFIMHEFVGWMIPECAKHEVRLNDEAFDYRWIDPKEALKLPLNQETYPLLEWYLTHEKRLKE